MSTSSTEVRVPIPAWASIPPLRKPADAKAHEQTTHARAQRDARISAAEAHAREVELQAQAAAERVKLEASAEAEHVRVDADARGQATRWMGDADAAARPFGAIDQMVVLNGAEGVSEVLAQALGHGVAGLQFARSVLAGKAAPADAGATVKPAQDNGHVAAASS